MDNIDYKAKVGFVPAGDGGRVTVVLSFASESPSLLGAEGISEWTTPSKSRRNNERKEASAPIDCGNGYGPLLGSGGNESIVGGNGGKVPSKGATVKPKTIMPKTVKPKTVKPKTVKPKTVKPKTVKPVTPEGSVSAFGWLSWPKLCWHNVLCTVFICLIAASASGGAFAYFSHGSDGLLPSIVVPDATALPTETERGPLFAPFNPAPGPVVPDVVEDPNWLIATSGFCSSLNVVMKERDVKGKMTAGDMDGHFVADISFNYYPQTAVKFTDFPYHKANTIEGDQNEADALVSSAWDHKNIALLEPASTCGPEQGDQAWGISVFKVEEHRSCTDGETAWEGHSCVHYSGYVSAATSNFVNVNEGRFVCQLFVDSAVERSTVAIGGGSMQTDSRTACDPCVEAQAVKDGKEECCLMIGYKCSTGFWNDDDDLCCSGECGLEWSGEYRCQHVEGQKDRRGDPENSVGWIGGRRAQHGGLDMKQEKCHLCVAGRAQYDDPATGRPVHCDPGSSIPY